MIKLLNSLVPLKLFILQPNLDCCNSTAIAALSGEELEEVGMRGIYSFSILHSYKTNINHPGNAEGNLNLGLTLFWYNLNCYASFHYDFLFSSNPKLTWITQ